MQERRQHPRQPVFLEVKQINGHPGKGTFMSNLSEAGAKLETSLTLSAGAPVRLSFVLPGETRETHRIGRVIWVMPAPVNGRFHMGLEFLMIP
jgi:hypothetical protein